MFFGGGQPEEAPTPEVKRWSDILKLFCIILLTLAIVKLILIPDASALNDLIYCLILFCAATGYSFFMLSFFILMAMFQVIYSVDTIGQLLQSGNNFSDKKSLQKLIIGSISSTVYTIGTRLFT